LAIADWLPGPFSNPQSALNSPDPQSALDCHNPQSALNSPDPQSALDCHNRQSALD
jgi:hypothetical protein